MDLKDPICETAPGARTSDSLGWRMEKKNPRPLTSTASAIAKHIQASMFKLPCRGRGTSFLQQLTANSFYFLNAN